MFKGIGALPQRVKSGWVYTQTLLAQYLHIFGQPIHNSHKLQNKHSDEWFEKMFSYDNKPSTFLRICDRMQPKG